MSGHKKPEQQEQISKLFYSLKEPAFVTGLSLVTLWRMEKEGIFPRRRQIGDRRSAHSVPEVLDWVATRPMSEIVGPKKAQGEGE